MPVSRSLPRRCRPAILLLAAVCAACGSLPEQHPDNRYQRASGADAGAAQALVEPVRQLQNQALAAINEDQYALAIDYLQRAIKIQPREAWSWHYLAEVYWRRGERERCLAMLDRSQSYSFGDTRLDDANAALRRQCL